MSNKSIATLPRLRRRINGESMSNICARLIYGLLLLVFTLPGASAAEYTLMPRVPREGIRA
jgi:hypothetical protein